MYSTPPSDQGVHLELRIGSFVFFELGGMSARV